MRSVEPRSRGGTMTVETLGLREHKHLVSESSVMVVSFPRDDQVRSIKMPAELPKIDRRDCGRSIWDCSR